MEYMLHQKKSQHLRNTTIHSKPKMSKPYDYLGQSSTASSTKPVPVDFTEYKVLSFDIYGTLINWETGIFNALLDRFDQTTLETTLAASSLDDLRTQLLSLFHRSEMSVQKALPSLNYPSVLKEAFLLIAERLEIKVDPVKAQSFGRTVGTWPAFKDTVEAIKKLQKHYKLVVLSNVSSSSFAATLRGPLNGLSFDSIYTAEDIGSYKPDVRNFEYLIKHVERDFKVGKEGILHVANSVTHDHVPVKKVGMRPGVWIERRGERAIMSGTADVEGQIKKGKVEFAARFKTLGLFAEEVERQFEEKSRNLL